MKSNFQGAVNFRSMDLSPMPTPRASLSDATPHGDATPRALDERSDDSRTSPHRDREVVVVITL